VGCTAADLADAAAAGRLGVAQSMRGRIEGLGGTMCLEAMPGQGVEVEFRVGR
jgi:signal transduction histidine kinase